MSTEAAAWDRVVDVVVVGSGGAALTAATLAHDQGAEVLVLEKADMLGGTTAVSGGGVWLPGNHKMAEAGIDDSREDALAYIRRLTNGTEPDPTGDGEAQLTIVEGPVGDGMCDAKHAGCFIVVNNASSSDPRDSVIVDITFKKQLKQ